MIRFVVQENEASIEAIIHAISKDNDSFLVHMFDGQTSWLTPYLPEDRAFMEPYVLYAIKAYNAGDDTPDHEHTYKENHNKRNKYSEEEFYQLEFKRIVFDAIEESLIEMLKKSL